MKDEKSGITKLIWLILIGTWVVCAKLCANQFCTYWDYSLDSWNQWKIRGSKKGRKIHPLVTLNICTTFLGNALKIFHSGPTQPTHNWTHIIISTVMPLAWLRTSLFKLDEIMFGVKKWLGDGLGKNMVMVKIKQGLQLVVNRMPTAVLLVSNIHPDLLPKRFCDTNITLLPPMLLTNNSHNSHVLVRKS